MATVRLLPVSSYYNKNVTKGSLLDGALLKLYILKNRNNKWNTGWTFKELLEEIPELYLDAVKCEERNGVKIESWNQDWFEKNPLVIPHNGITLDSDNDLHKFWMKVLPIYGEPITYDKSSTHHRYLFYLENKDAEAAERLKTAAERRQASQAIEKLTGYEVVQIAGLFGRNTRYQSESIIKADLMEVIEKDINKARKVISYLKDKASLENESLAKLAIEYFVVNVTEKGIFYNDQFLAFNVAEFVTFLSKVENQNLKLSISKTVKEARTNE